MAKDRRRDGNRLTRNRRHERRPESLVQECIDKVTMSE